MDKRTILAVVLSLAVLFTYQIFFAKQPLSPRHDVPKQESPNPPELSANQTVAAPTPSAAPFVAKTVAKKITTRKEELPKDITVETPNYIAIFSTKGAALKSFKLKHYHEECVTCVPDIWPIIKNALTGKKQPPRKKSDAPIELITVKENMPYPLSFSFSIPRWTYPLTLSTRRTHCNFRQQTIATNSILYLPVYLTMG